MIRTLFLCIFFAVTWLLGGCTQPQRVQSVEVRSARLEDRVSRLERSNRTLQGAVDSLSALVQEQTDEIRSRRADSHQALEDLEALLHSLQAEIQRNNEKIGQLEDLVQFHLVADGAAGRDSVRVPDQPQVPTPETTSPSFSEAESGGPRSLYEAARQDQMRGNYSLAIMGYEDLLTQYPTSTLADNARYWIGECYYVQREYKHALKEFQKLLDDYPGEEKVPDAMLKIGLCYVNLHENEAAKQAFKDLQEAYPNSELGRLATEKLQSLH